MRTNIVLDDKLIRRAQKLTGIKTKREVCMKHFLRQKGITVCKTMDSLIATYCIENDHELPHNDSDFDGYEEHLGPRVVHP